MNIVLTKTEQLDILLHARRQLDNSYIYGKPCLKGLCRFIRNSIRVIAREPEDCLTQSIESLIPNFNIKNAKLFGATEERYWWECNKEGDKQRSLFLNFLINSLYIECYKQDIKNIRTHKGILSIKEQLTILEDCKYLIKSSYTELNQALIKALSVRFGIKCPDSKIKDYIPSYSYFVARVWTLSVIKHPSVAEPEDWWAIPIIEFERGRDQLEFIKVMEYLTKNTSKNIWYYIFKIKRMFKIQNSIN